MTKSKSLLEPTQYLNSPNGSGKSRLFCVAWNGQQVPNLFVGQPSFAPKFIKKKPKKVGQNKSNGILIR
jgi:hypothetical protein